MTSARAILCFLSVIIGAGALVPTSWAQSPSAGDPAGCGTPTPTPGAFGPVDYRKATAQERVLVESNHFTPGIESMTRPKNTDMLSMASDVAYTLDVFPNHHRALRTMWRLSNRDGKNPANGGKRTVECWFDRAIRYASDDPIPRLMFAQYLREKGRNGEALAQADRTLPLARDNPFTHYNLGLTYFELGAFDQAARQAATARDLGMPRPELIDKLKKAGKWTEPAAPAASAPEPAASAAPAADPASGPGTD